METKDRLQTWTTKHGVNHRRGTNTTKKNQSRVEIHTVSVSYGLRKSSRINPSLIKGILGDKTDKRIKYLDFGTTDMIRTGQIRIVFDPRDVPKHLILLLHIKS